MPTAYLLMTSPILALLATVVIPKLIAKQQWLVIGTVTATLFGFQFIALQEVHSSFDSMWRSAGSTVSVVACGFAFYYGKRSDSKWLRWMKW